MPEIILPYEPIVVTDTTNLSREEWLAYRKTGIGGSEVAAIFGISPFGTARDIYYDKLNIAAYYDDEENKYQKQIGTLLEDTVAEMFEEVTGYRVFKIRKMYRSCEHPCMIADVDFFIQLPDGSFAILECKTTSPDATAKWWDGSKPAIPLNYQLQGRHYSGYILDRLRIQSWKIPLSSIMGKGGSTFCCRPLDYPPARTVGAVNGGRSPFTCR